MEEVVAKNSFKEAVTKKAKEIKQFYEEHKKPIMIAKDSLMLAGLAYLGYKYKAKCKDYSNVLQAFNADEMVLEKSDETFDFLVNENYMARKIINACASDGTKHGSPVCARALKALDGVPNMYAELIN